ncbi:hypothetical protein BST96_13830 [Oceanicoccus sagamiensis]|uniref:beta-N-acetylhexosaminidase n=1 Tax=Oceanicoccus sagamiensis TaxID=716816 RepID=A0A1X9NAN2_9GAMM|nr:hypothetical protein BST96_13830 [Oceanicoccus sagamiensis]
MSGRCSSIKLIPRPVALLEHKGSLSLGPTIGLVGNDKSLTELLDYTATEVFQTLECVSYEQPPQGVHLSLLLEATTTAIESYHLVIDQEKIQITAASITGLFWGLQTLRQLLWHYKQQLPQLTISDKPRFPYRGMHLDVGRHFMPVEGVKRYIDLIALHKMNTFHWHLTDDQGWRIAINAYPKLTEVGAWREQTVVGHTSNADPQSDGKAHGGFYSQQQIKDVVAYAAARQITVIPEIDVPGHASAILAAYPEFACGEKDTYVQGRFGIFTEVLCNKEAVFEFLTVVLAEIAALFPSEHIHIGGDEVKKVQWQACDCCNDIMQQIHASDYNALHSYFVKRVQAIAEGLNKKIIGWDELLDGGSIAAPPLCHGGVLMAAGRRRSKAIRL